MLNQNIKTVHCRHTEGVIHGFLGWTKNHLLLLLPEGFMETASVLSVSSALRNVLLTTDNNW